MEQWNNDKCQSQCIQPITLCVCEKGYVENPSTCTCEYEKDCVIDKYLKDCECMKSLVDDLVVKCDEVEDT